MGGNSTALDRICENPEQVLFHFRLHYYCRFKRKFCAAEPGALQKYAVRLRTLFRVTAEAGLLKRNVGSRVQGETLKSRGFSKAVGNF